MEFKCKSISFSLLINSHCSYIIFFRMYYKSYILKIVSFYLFFLSFRIRSRFFCFCIAHGTSRINDDTADLSTPGIREKNDQHLAQILHTFENGSSTGKVNTNQNIRNFKDILRMSPILL